MDDDGNEIELTGEEEFRLTPKGFLITQLMYLGASYERAENEWHRLEAFCVREIADQEGAPYAALVFDGVGGDDGLAPVFERVGDGGKQVGERLANAGGGLDDKGALPFQCLTDELGHALLLGAIFEVLGRGEDALLGEGMVHSLGERGACVSFQCGVPSVNHSCIIGGWGRRAMRFRGGDRAA